MATPPPRLKSCWDGREAGGVPLRFPPRSKMPLIYGTARWQERQFGTASASSLMVRLACRIQIQPARGAGCDGWLIGGCGQILQLLDGPDRVLESPGFGVGDVQRGQAPGIAAGGEFAGAFRELDGLAAVAEFGFEIGREDP